MKQRTADNLTGLLAGVLAIICLILFIDEAGATSYKNPEAKAEATAEATADAASDAAASAEQTQTATASNDGVTVSEESHVENNSSNVVLVPNNNTESCVRVFGLAFGRNGESGALGVPWRSKACDFEQAADDAFAAGERELGWFWKCQNKSLYRIFQAGEMTADQAKLECHRKAVGMNSAQKTIDDLRQRLEVADEYVDYLKSHQKVCDESLERCKEKAFGEK